MRRLFDLTDAEFDWRRWLMTVERLTWKGAAKALFLGVLLFVLLISVAADSILLSALAAAVFSAWLWIALPKNTIRDIVRPYATGEAGLAWRERVYSTLGRAWRYVTNG